MAEQKAAEEARIEKLEKKNASLRRKKRSGIASVMRRGG